MSSTTSCTSLLIYFFCYFWTAITFNPKDMADNLKNYGTFIPGYRPGRRTADYLEKVMVRITYVGAGFLAVVAIIPTLVSTWMGVNYGVASFYGGTSLLIAVSVAFDLVQKIDSHLVMRNYRGLLERADEDCRNRIRHAGQNPATMRIVFIGPPGRRQRHPGRAAWSRPTGWPTSPPATCSAPPATPRPKSVVKAEQYMSAGQLVPDDLIVAIIAERLRAARLPPADTCWTVSRAPSPRPRPWTPCWPRRGRRWTRCWNCRCRKKSCSERLAGRGRADDKPEVIRQRLVAYRQQTEPLVGLLRQERTACRASMGWARWTRSSPALRPSWTRFAG